MRPRAPFSDPAGRLVQASPSLPNCVTSTSGAVTEESGAEVGAGVAVMLLSRPGTPAPLTETREMKACELVVAPAAITLGA